MRKKRTPVRGRRVAGECSARPAADPGNRRAGDLLASRRRATSPATLLVLLGNMNFGFLDLNSSRAF